MGVLCQLLGLYTPRDVPSTFHNRGSGSCILLFELALEPSVVHTLVQSNVNSSDSMREELTGF